MGRRDANWSRVCAVLAWSMWVGACGGGGTSPTDDAAVAADRHFPLDADSRWVYATSDSSNPDLQRVIGARAGITGTVMQFTSGIDGSVGEVGFVVSDSGVREYAPAGSDALTRLFENTELIRYPARPGDSFVQFDTTLDTGIDFDADGRTDTMKVRSVISVLAIETVTTPAGTFARSLHQRQTIDETVYYSGGHAANVYRITSDIWYAPNVGVVKYLGTFHGGGGPDETSSQELTAYRVGTLTNDRVAPVVVAVTPETAPTRGTNLSISAVFSERMDSTSFAPGSFTVVDSANLPIAGTVQVEGNTVRFVSGQAWASGNYTARIGTGALDLVGNAMAAARSWDFTVDATGPGLVSSVPAPGAVDVGLASAIVLQFSEAPDPATVNPGNLTLRTNGAAVPITLSVDGSRVTVTPTGGMQRAQFYEVAVSGVTDVLGNPMSQGSNFSFRTAQGRYAYPTALFPGGEVMTDAMAIGDVNGDGFTDVLLTTTTALDPANEFALLMFAGRSDGTLAAPVRVSIGTLLTGYLESIAIGDVNGDGRPDVVVGSNFVGAQVLHQTPSGSLVPAEFLPRATAGRLRIADLDRDGRLDLVGVGGGSGNAALWRQDATGTLVFRAELPTSISVGHDVEIGDVNGDGRPDIVVVGTGYPDHDVSVLQQQPDGSFGAATMLATRSVWGGSAVAIGDLNGDGRQDIVVTTGGNSPTSIVVFYQGAGGVLGPATDISTYDSPMAVRVADVDGDGRSDVIVSHIGWNAVGIYLQQASGVLAPELRFAAPYGSFNPQSMAVGDVNRDGRLDIAIAGELLLQKGSAVAGTQRLLPGAAGLRAGALVNRVGHIGPGASTR